MSPELTPSALGTEQHTPQIGLEEAGAHFWGPPHPSCRELGPLHLPPLVLARLGSSGTCSRLRCTHTHQPPGSLPQEHRSSWSGGGNELTFGLSQISFQTHGCPHTLTLQPGLRLDLYSFVE